MVGFIMINLNNLKPAFANFQQTTPFPHAVIDNFLDIDFANRLASEFPPFDSNSYNGKYENQIELKKTCNIWDKFPENTYKILSYLNSPQFVNLMSELTGCDTLYADPGLHGGGWHTHPTGGKLNPHLDYSLHPKLGLQRKFNLLIYLTPDWEDSWGGHFGIWNIDADKKPTTVYKTIMPKFNRAVVFDTTMDSWHGLATQVSTPINKTRNSIAVYYLTDPPANVDPRKRALFAPTQDQVNNQEVLDLIKRRSQVTGTSVEEWIRK